MSNRRAARGSTPPSPGGRHTVPSLLAGRDITRVYKILTREGIPQRTIAQLTGQSQSDISEILKGRQVMGYDVLVRICTGFGIPRGLMGLAYAHSAALTARR